jgi:hypothetical protein
MAEYENIENFDFYCTDYAQRMVDDVKPAMKKFRFGGGDIETVITKSLSVLQRNGVYAFITFVVWKKNNGTRAERETCAKMEELVIGQPGDQTLLRLDVMHLNLGNKRYPLDIGQMLSKDLDALLFAKELIGRTLIYARYHAKALK